MSATTGQILEEIKRPGVIAYNILCSPAAFELYPSLLVKLLKDASVRFKHICKISPQKATFESVIDPYLHMTDEINIVYGFIESLNGTNNSDKTRKVIESFQPKLVSYYNEISLSKPFYSLLKHVNKLKLTHDQKKSVELLKKDMEVSGVHEPVPITERLKAINKEITKLSEKFENNVIDSRKEFYYEFFDDSSLLHLPESDLEEARKEARRRKSKAKFVFTLSPPSVQAVLKYCTNRSVRELFYKKNNSIAVEGKTDNRPVIQRVLHLRREKAKLLGFKNYVEYVLQLRMAKSPREILSMLNKIFVRGHAKAQNEMKEMRRFAHQKDIQEWDRAYFAQQLRKQKFDIDEKILRQYFPLPKVVEGLFAIIKKIYGIEMKEIKIKSYDSSVRTFEVFRKGKRIAYYIADFYARPEKRGGAWCNDLRRGFETSSGEQVLPIIINVMNFGLPQKNAPSLLTHRDVETLFHEFGHALHAMLSSNSYPNLSGFNTEWDFVEFPSQFFENWCWEKTSLDLIASHYKSRKTLPVDLLKKLRATKTFMSGYSVVRQNEFAFLDLYLHLGVPPKSISALDSLCGRLVRKYSVLPKWKDYRMYASFGHIFAGGYAAGYYSYAWAEILEADCFEYVHPKGVLNPKVMQKYASAILEPGARASGSKLFSDFVGRKPNVRAYIKKHNLAK